MDSAKGWRDCQPLVLQSQTAILVELEQNGGLTTRESSRSHHVQAITDGVPNILQLTRGVACSLLYPGSGHSQSLALCLCNAALVAVYQTIIIVAFIQEQLPFLLRSSLSAASIRGRPLNMERRLFKQIQ